MTILDLVRVLRANLRTLLIAALLGLALAAAYTATRPVLYTASSTVQVVGGNSSDPSTALASQQLTVGRAGSYAQLASSPGVVERIAKASQRTLSPQSISVTGTQLNGTATLTLSAVAPTPSGAQRAATLAQSALREEAHYMETLGTSDTTIFQVVPLRPAARPAAPSSPSWPKNLLLGLAVGLVGGGAWVTLRKQLDSRVRHSGDVEAITGSGVLGIIPKTATLRSERRGGLGNLGPAAESFRMLRTNLRYVSSDQPPRSLVITSAVQGEGKSTVAANLARVLAAAGQQVILVDTDLRRPTVHSTFSAENLVGLTEVLTGQVSLRAAIQPGDHANLHLITSGRIPPNPSELLGSRRMSAIIEALSERYFVVLDAPPLLPVTDAGLLTVASDGAAVVYHHGRARREQVELCAKILDQVGGNYYGSIINMTPPKQMGSTIYGYGAGRYGGGYGLSYGESADAPSALNPSNEIDDLSLEDTPRDGQAASADHSAIVDTSDGPRSPAASAEAPQVGESDASRDPAPSPNSQQTPVAQPKGALTAPSRRSRRRSED